MKNYILDPNLIGPVDKGVPMPCRPTGKKYPFEEMEVGDSFFVRGETARINPAYWGKKLNVKFATRFVVENNVRGTRVWRIM